MAGVANLLACVLLGVVSGSPPAYKAIAARQPPKEQLEGPHGQGRETIPEHRYKQDCWKKRPLASLTALSRHVYKIPGAGMEPEGIEPFVKVLKDGFSEVACIKDYMYYHGDAFGGNKHEYKIKDSSNVSIVHYKDIVPSEDQKAMSHEVCFDFCRTVPDMGFFGLMAGRECYCMPYYKMMAGDSSECDAVCEGKPTTMCGGMMKSSIFELHLCANTAEKMKDAVGKAKGLSATLTGVGSSGLKQAEELQTAAADLQGVFGSAGDPCASGLMQSAKVFAGELQHTSEDTVKLGEKLEELQAKAEKMLEGDFTDFETIKEAEATMKEMKETSDAGDESSEKTLKALVVDDVNKHYSGTGNCKCAQSWIYPKSYADDDGNGDACAEMQHYCPSKPCDEDKKGSWCVVTDPECDKAQTYDASRDDPDSDQKIHYAYCEAEGESKTVLKQYVNIMLLVDKEFKDVPSTCCGDELKVPMYMSVEACAKTCDAEGKACAGFSFFDHSEDGSGGVCIMFTKFKEVTYYTECGEPEDEKGGKEFLVQIHKRDTFLQASKANTTDATFLKKKKAPSDTVCYAKFHDFNGVSLKPDPSGKCDLCLKKANKAQRCFA